MGVKYRQVPAPVGYPGKVYRDGRVLEHHLVWWRRTGEIVPKGFVLHHKNGDGKDNRFCNLRHMRRGAHTSQHHRVGPKTVIVRCAFCRRKVEKTSRYVRAKRSAGQITFFCSKAHAARAQARGRHVEIRHGTSVAYHYHRCRCAICKKAHSARVAKYVSEKRRAIRQGERQ